MILDAQQEFSDSQALTVTAVSTNVIDLGVDRDIGPGESMVVTVNAVVAAGGTSPTIQVVVQTDDNESFSSLTAIATSPVTAAMAAGDKIVLPIGVTNEQYLRLSYVITGTTPTHTVDAYLQPYSMIDATVDYANGYDIT